MVYAVTRFKHLANTLQLIKTIFKLNNKPSLYFMHF